MDTKETDQGEVHSSMSNIDMQWREATDADIPLLAGMNARLIEDEGHQNPMTPAQLEQRMRNWLAGQYTAVIFENQRKPVAYALYRPADDGWDGDGVYLRQFFVERDLRRSGIGRSAIELMRNEVWSKGARVTLETLVHNQTAQEFFKSVGFREYCISFELRGGEKSLI